MNEGTFYLVFYAGSHRVILSVCRICRLNKQKYFFLTLQAMVSPSYFKLIPPPPVRVPALPKLSINYLPLYQFFPTFLFCLTIFHFTVYQFSLPSFSNSSNPREAITRDLVSRRKIELTTITVTFKYCPEHGFQNREIRSRIKHSINGSLESCQGKKIFSFFMLLLVNQLQKSTETTY
jgi:hypothetical protein